MQNNIDGRTRDLLKNTAIISVGKICTQLVSFLLLPLYTTVLSKEEYGTVDLLNTYTMLVIPLVIFQIEQALFRKLLDVRKDEAEKRRIITSVFYFVIFQIAIYTLFFILFGKAIIESYYVYYWLNVISTIILNVLLQMTRGEGKNGSYALAGFIVALLTIVFNIVTIVPLKLGVNGMLISIFLGNSAGIVYLFFATKITEKVHIKNWSPKIVKECLKYSLPLIPDALSWWVISASDRSIISYFCGLDANGIVSVSQKFSSVYIAAYNIFHLSWTEQVSLHMGDGDRDEYFSRIVNRLLVLFVTISVCIISGVGLFFKLLVNDSFSDSYGLVPLHMMSGLFCAGAGIFGGLFIGQKNTSGMAATTTIAASINVIINLAGVSSLGIYIAPISSILAYLTIMILRYRKVSRTVQIKIRNETCIITLGLFCLCLFMYYINISIIHIFNVCVMVSISLYVNRDILVKARNGIVSKIRQR